MLQNRYQLAIPYNECNSLLLQAAKHQRLATALRLLFLRSESGRCSMVWPGLKDRGVMTPHALDRVLSACGSCQFAILDRARHPIDLWKAEQAPTESHNRAEYRLWAVLWQIQNQGNCENLTFHELVTQGRRM